MPDRDPLLVALGIALRQRREDRRISQEGLSLNTGVHRNYIGGIERGERQPTVITISKLAKALGIPTSELLAAAEHVLAAELIRKTQT